MRIGISKIDLDTPMVGRPYILYNFSENFYEIKEILPMVEVVSVKSCMRCFLLGACFRHATLPLPYNDLNPLHQQQIFDYLSCQTFQYIFISTGFNSCDSQLLVIIIRLWNLDSAEKWSGKSNWTEHFHLLIVYKS